MDTFLNNVILDIKIYMASFDQEAWIKMVLYDKEFKAYACTNIGMKKFIDIFHQVKYSGALLKTTYLFGKKVNINNKAAVTSTNGYEEWYYNNEQLHIYGVIRKNGGIMENFTEKMIYPQ